MIALLVATLLLVGGVAFIVIAGVGVARLPDTFQRMHAATKAGGIGTTFVVLGVLVAGMIARVVPADLGDRPARVGDLLFVLPRNRHDQERLAKVAGLADQLLAASADDRPGRR